MPYLVFGDSENLGTRHGRYPREDFLFEIIKNTRIISPKITQPTVEKVLEHVRKF